MSESATEDVDYYNPFDGTKGRHEGQYLDIAERVEAEKRRALAEGREPELDDVGALPAGVGTPLVVDELRVDNSHYSNPSAALNPRNVDPIQTLPVGQDEDTVVEDTVVEYDENGNPV